MTGHSLEAPRELVVGAGGRWAVWRAVGNHRRRALVGLDRLVVTSLVALAGLLRLPALEARGRFDADQGIDMLVLLRLVGDGTLPLLGPEASVGELHHGVLYYLLLAPVAIVTNADPWAISATIAAFGVATVGVTWWLARAIGGWLAGLLAGLLVALSPAAIETSTFIWVANPIPFFAALALAAAWHARSTRRGRWWVLALGAAGAVWQLHLVGVLFLVPIVGLLAADLYRARREGASDSAKRIIRGALAGGALITVLFLPFAIHELQTGLSQSQRIAAYLAAVGEPGQLDSLARLSVVVLRATTWPFSGVVTDAPAAALAAFVVVLSVAVWALIVERGERRVAIGWLVLAVAWTACGLTLAAPSLESVMPGLPNDHYHSFLLPALAVLVGVGLSRMWRRVPVVAVVLMLILVGVEMYRSPSPVDANGGWPAARSSGARAAGVVGDSPVAVVGVPGFKSAAGTVYPLVLAGARVVEPAAADFVVVPCDRVFERVVGRRCGGPAEDELVGRVLAGSASRVVSRFDESPRISISIYSVEPGGR